MISVWFNDTTAKYQMYHAYSVHIQCIFRLTISIPIKYVCMVSLSTLDVYTVITERTITIH